jgi:hypothetical protein
MTDLKYLHTVVQITDSMQKALGEVPRRSGMYNWMFLFNGKMRAYKFLEEGELEKNDVVQVNCSPMDMTLINRLHEKLKNSSTMLVLNNDYVAEAWDDWKFAPDYYQTLLDKGDMIFGTEPCQTSHMGDRAYCFPHPTWTKMLKHYGRDPDKVKKGHIANIFHWWDGRTFSSHLCLEQLKKKHPTIWTKLYAYNPGNDKSAKYSKAMWDEILPIMDYPGYLESVMHNEFMYEPCQFHTYGRNTVDSACIGLPSMGSDRVWSLKHCFPEMVCDPGDLRKTRAIMEKIMKGGSWLDEQMDYAYDAVEYFNYKNSKERYLAALEESRKRCGK